MCRLTLLYIVRFLFGSGVIFLIYLSCCVLYHLEDEDEYFLIDEILIR